MKHQAEWAPRVAAAIKSRTMDELMTGFIREGAVGGRVNDSGNACADPQVQFNDIVVEIPHGDIGRVRGARPPALFARSAAVAAGPAPHLGEHGVQILAGLGYDADAVAGFVAEGAVSG